MASAAEQLAANLNFGAFAKAEALKKRIWFTLGVLLIYRLGTYVPMPGIDPDALAQAFNANQSGIIGMFNMFSGGAVARRSAQASCGWMLRTAPADASKTCVVSQIDLEFDGTSFHARWTHAPGMPASSTRKWLFVSGSN